MEIDRLISDLEECREWDLLTANQVSDIDDVLRILRAHQILSEGSESGAEHKLDRIVAKLTKERIEYGQKIHDPKGKRFSEFGEGYRMGISKAVSVIKGEMTDE